MFDALLHQVDARRATEVLDAVLAHGLRCALTGSLAVDCQLRSHGRQIERRPLNDIYLVVDGFASIPESIAGSFLLKHVHPCAAEGKPLRQLIDQPRAVRVDLFRAFRKTLSRAEVLNETGHLNVLAVEDLVARTTALGTGASEGANALTSSTQRRSPGCSASAGISSWQRRDGPLPGCVRYAPGRRA